MWRRNTLIQRGDAKSSAGSPGGDLVMPGPGGALLHNQSLQNISSDGEHTPALHETTDPSAAAPSGSTRGI